MKKTLAIFFFLVFGMAANIAEGAEEAGKEYEKTGKYVSQWGTQYYAQGGVVVDGIAYFTASSNDYSQEGVPQKDADFPFIVVFDAKTLQKIRTYPFDDTYDSTPLVIQNARGQWLVIAHEYQKERTAARDRDTGEMVWTSEANQPGKIFFGYSYYKQDDGSLIIFVACKNGLHGISSEDGRELWHVKRKSKGGVTPTVDQKGGIVYYQCDGEMLKINAKDGQVLQKAKVAGPNVCMSWNTILVNDKYGYYVATYWYDAENPYFHSAVRVYDRDLKLIWEKTGLPIGKKSTLTYVDGKLITGCGDSWSKQYQGTEKNAGADWKFIPAYSIQTGETIWKCDLSEYAMVCVMNVPYFNGSNYAECSPAEGETSKIFRINVGNGKLEEVYDYGCRVHSCAQPIISGGRMYSGSLAQDRIVVTELAAGSAYEWQGAFGDPQTHTNAVPDQPGVTAVPIKEVLPQPSASEAIDIGDRLELMLDEYLIDQIKDVRFVLHHPQRAERVIEAEKPWEKGSTLNHVTVFKDGDLYRMYYCGHVGDPGLSSQNDHVTCYAESKDGIHWTRPNLGLFEWDGSKENNIVWFGGKTPAPFIDKNPSCPADQKYKALVGSSPAYALVSGDAIHWRLLSDQPVLEKTFGHAARNAQTQKYMAHTRKRNQGCRYMAYTESDDFLHWSKPVLIDTGDAPVEHLYWNTLVPYFRTDHIYLGFPMRLAYHEGVEGDRTDAALTFTRDGFHVSRKYMEGFLRPGLNEKNWHPHCNMMGLGIVPTGEDEISMYYDEDSYQPTAAIRRLTLRTDGFVSLQADYHGGEFTTKPLRFLGNRLIVNISTSAAGSLKVEIQDAQGKPIPGYRLKDSVEYFGDSIGAELKWKDGADVGKLAGTPVRLRMVMQDADLYALQFRTSRR